MEVWPAARSTAGCVTSTSAANGNQAKNNLYATMIHVKDNLPLHQNPLEDKENINL